MLSKTRAATCRAACFNLGDGRMCHMRRSSQGRLASWAWYTPSRCERTLLEFASLPTSADCEPKLQNSAHVGHMLLGHCFVRRCVGEHKVARSIRRVAHLQGGTQGAVLARGGRQGGFALGAKSMTRTGAYIALAACRLSLQRSLAWGSFTIHGPVCQSHSTLRDADEKREDPVVRRSLNSIVDYGAELVSTPSCAVGSASGSDGAGKCFDESSQAAFAVVSMKSVS